jgi:hypothetical protein
MQGLIRPGESGWQFEMNASERSHMLPDTFMSIAGRESGPLPMRYFCTGVIRGFWVPRAVELCRRHGVEVDLSKRPLQPLLHRWFKQNIVWGTIKRTYWRLSQRMRRVPVRKQEASA